MSRFAASLVMVLLAAPGPSQGAERIPPPRPIGKPGEVVGGYTLTLTGPTRIRYGRHVDVTISAIGSSTELPTLDLNWRNPARTIYLELAADRGEIIPFRPEAGGGGGSGGASFTTAQLRPIGPHSRGPGLAPGKYRLRVVVDARQDPFRPDGWVGRIEAEPVTFTVVGNDKAKLTSDAACRLLADLNAENPATRLKAVLRIPPTTNEDVLAALVERLADPHEVVAKGLSTHPGLARPVADAACYDVIPSQGPAVIGPLLSFAARPANAPHHQKVAWALGELGPDPRSLRFLLNLVEKGSHHERCAAVAALGRIGPEAVPNLIRLARSEKQSEIIRRLAIEEMWRHGTAESVGPFLRDTLWFNKSEHAWSAALVIGKIGDRTALPDLKRLAEAGEGYIADSVLLWAFVGLADARATRDLMMKLLHGINGHRASGILRAVAESDDVPRFLEFLEDPKTSQVARSCIDSILRSLADKPDGVGYDATKPDPELWRAWWKNRR